MKTKNILNQLYSDYLNKTFDLKLISSHKEEINTEIDKIKGDGKILMHNNLLLFYSF